MRAFVTGGTGFVGSAVVRALLARGRDVSCLVRPGSDRRNLDGLAVTLVEGDLDASDTLVRALSGCDELYHVAAAYSTRAEDAAAMMRVNVEGTRHILTAGAEAGLSHIVHTSTIGTIGRPGANRLPNEDDLFEGWETASPYARSKLDGERVALDLARQGAPIVVVNPCAPLGARDIKPSSTGQRVLDYMRGRTPSFSPGGINFVPVEDVAQGHLLAAERGRVGQRYILGHSEGNLRLAGFCALMERVTGVRLARASGRTGARRALARLRGLVSTHRPSPGASGVGQDQRPSALTADPARAVTELGLPQTPLDVAVGQAVDWFRANGYLERGWAS